jgi:hypothetical protein
MTIERDWVITEALPLKTRKGSIYGSKSYKSYTKRYPKRKPKNLVIPYWENINTIDKTTTTKLLKPNHTGDIIIPKYETTIFKQSVRTNCSVASDPYNVPWQLRFEEDKPYDVKFCTEDWYLPTICCEPHELEGLADVIGTDTVSSTGAKPEQWDTTLFHPRRGTSILKKRLVPWEHIADTTTPHTYKELYKYYIRGQVRRIRNINRARREVEQQYRLTRTFDFFKNQLYTSTLSTAERIDFNNRFRRLLQTVDLGLLVSGRRRRRYGGHSINDTYFN